MIMTSYTRLVVQSHQDDCVELFAGFSRRLTRRSPKLPKSEAYREHDGTVVRLGPPVPISAEVTELVHVTSRQIHGAA
ncbi:MAG TPA: hypothetical protein VHR64_14380 [Thermomicrobiales bacterium]|jgi:hypothetical protein|nr:hypothetical protein [Thermomicrobiales bacterium]